MSAVGNEMQNLIKKSRESKLVVKQTVPVIGGVPESVAGIFVVLRTKMWNE